MELPAYLGAIRVIVDIAGIHSLAGNYPFDGIPFVRSFNQFEMLADMRDQDTSLLLILHESTVQQVFPVLRVHVLCEQGQVGTATPAS